MANYTKDEIKGFAQSAAYATDSEIAEGAVIPRKGNTLTGLIDPYTGELLSFNKVTTLPNGDAITDADCDGIIYRKYGTEYFKRDFSGYVNVKWFGAVGDGTTDDTTAIQAAAASGMDLWFPTAIGYRTTDTITLSNSINLLMEACILYDGANDRKALVIGASGSVISNKTLTVNVRNNSQSNWSNSSCVGVEIFNANTCRITIVSAYRFTKGVRFVGSAGGFAYNNVTLGEIRNNNIGVELDAVLSGWVNENNYINGKFDCTSNLMTGTARYGVKITSSDSTYLNNNNNVFIKPSFELFEATAIPIWIAAGVNNTFEKCRNETASTYFAKIEGNSTENIITCGYGNASVNDTSKSNNLLKGARSINSDLVKPLVFHSGHLPSKAAYYNSTDVNIAGIFLIASTGLQTPANHISNITIAADYIEIPTSRGVAITVKCNSVKEFVIKRSCISGYGGRVSIKLYDSAGVALDNTNVVRSTIFSTLSWATSFGGSWQTGSDSDNDLYVNVPANADTMRVIISGGSAACRLQTFSVYALSAKAAPAWTGFNDLCNQFNVATQAPTLGTYQANKIIYNDTPAAAGWIGWVCVAGGTPGTWKGFGEIEA